MVLINSLWFVVKVLGLVFLVGLLFNLILDGIIIKPIMQRAADKKKLEILDIILDKMQNGEIITEDDVDELEEELKN